MLDLWRQRRVDARMRRHAEAARQLVSLTQRFLAGELDAATYDARFFRSYQSSDGLGPAFGPLDELAMACEAYVDDPALRDEPGDLDADDLRAAARRALARLTALSPLLVSPPPRPAAVVLRDLVEHRAFALDLLDELRDLDWDGPELVVLTPRHVLHVLDLRERGTIRDAEVVAWAEAVEAREDLGRDPGSADLVDDAVFVLANPDLHPDLPADLVERLRAG